MVKNSRAKLQTTETENNLSQCDKNSSQETCMRTNDISHGFKCDERKLTQAENYKGGQTKLAMKHQQVSVDYWQMCKTLAQYCALTGLVWVMMRLFNAVFMLPQRLRNQQRTIEDTLEEMKRRYPDLAKDLTADDLRNAEKEIEDFLKENETKETANGTDESLKLTKTTEGKETTAKTVESVEETKSIEPVKEMKFTEKNKKDI